MKKIFTIFQYNTILKYRLKPPRRGILNRLILRQLDEKEILFYEDELYLPPPPHVCTYCSVSDFTKKER